MDLGAVKVLLEAQDRTFKNTLDLVVEQLKLKIHSAEKTIQDLKVTQDGGEPPNVGSGDVSAVRRSDGAGAVGDGSQVDEDGVGAGADDGMGTGAAGAAGEPAGATSGDGGGTVSPARAMFGLGGGAASLASVVSSDSGANVAVDAGVTGRSATKQQVKVAAQ
ncbi:hypothetical protein Pcinc_012866 [Petrolisthes cinctipes]|uniref:Uncharacterized protein n=1 Tax=Petrolisthes cinctipes TaxID=88211 RepID=A0AAE1KT75_PETCI|nr:hypothetical protein Pcinc_012865 [Petrolisthes cinctipes]KAK3882788.1 hypothetical protein Pcinc_012866 [Petrolisthes cinctipes]